MLTILAVIVGACSAVTVPDILTSEGGVKNHLLRSEVARQVPEKGHNRMAQGPDDTPPSDANGHEVPEDPTGAKHKQFSEKIQRTIADDKDSDDDYTEEPKEEAKPTKTASASGAVEGETKQNKAKEGIVAGAPPPSGDAHSNAVDGEAKQNKAKGGTVADAPPQDGDAHSNVPNVAKPKHKPTAKKHHAKHKRGVHRKRGDSGSVRATASAPATLPANSAAKSNVASKLASPSETSAAKSPSQEAASAASPPSSTARSSAQEQPSATEIVDPLSPDSAEKLREAKEEKEASARSASPATSEARSKTEEPPSATQKLDPASSTARSNIQEPTLAAQNVDPMMPGSSDKLKKEAAAPAASPSGPAIPIGPEPPLGSQEDDDLALR